MEQIARWLVIAGVVILAIGVVLYFAPWLLNWFGKLPGDIRIETRHSKVFFPVTSMLIVSIVLSIIINLFKK
ncbi:DUF2905 domain-containing protein [Nitrosomonas sp.]|uniref:DUF2905 domain-containing protein n=1 Tax=Nitrosomonas sp. TaxID=42353 RepID=UPI002600D6C5|nr:DUF2905 domain-containing protein [Nitrosomonas sp.]MCC6917468.1 DUF2905 domain-containing protein [Nitrosomonas sp.]